jgi:NDP-sugar pyrophosphorylase family protein
MALEAKRLGIRITFSHEDVPLGTAGPLALAKSILVRIVFCVLSFSLLSDPF